MGLARAGRDGRQTDAGLGRRGRLLCRRLGGTVSTQHPLWRRRVRATAAPGVWSRLAHGRARPGEAVSIWRDQALRWCRSSWVDVAWVVFVGLNLAAMRLLPAWQTVPFLAIWVSLTAIYGFRLWRLQPTILTLAAVTLATGGVIGVQVGRASCRERV